MYDLIVKNGILVLPEGPVTGSILVKDGMIVSITTDTVHEEAARTIDASGCYVFPGAITLPERQLTISVTCLNRPRI